MPTQQVRQVLRVCVWEGTDSTLTQGTISKHLVLERRDFVRQEENHLRSYVW